MFSSKTFIAAAVFAATKMEIYGRRWVGSVMATTACTYFRLMGRALARFACRKSSATYVSAALNAIDCSWQAVRRFMPSTLKLVVEPSTNASHRS